MRLNNFSIETLTRDEMARPIRIVAIEDDPLANPCFVDYAINSTCDMPGLEIEYIHTVINGMMKRPVEFLKVDTYQDMEDAIDTGKADIMGLSYILEEMYNSRTGWMVRFPFCSNRFCALVRPTMGATV